MNKLISLLRAAAAAIAALLMVTPSFAQPFGLWNFDAGNLSATVGQPMTYLDAATQTATTYNTTAGFGIPAINGTNANVMKFPALQQPMGYGMPSPGANGGGSLVNDYTLILDLLYPASSSGLIRPIIQTDDGILTAAADIIISSSGGLGTAGGPFFGAILPNTWHRVGIVVKGTSQQIRFYIDGVEVGTSPIVDTFDSQYSLTANSTVQILNNNTTNAAPGYVNSIQLRDVALTAGQVQAFGGAAASGIPTTIPSVPSFISTRAPGIDATGVSPAPAVQVVLDQGDTTVTPGSIKLYLDTVLVAATVTPSANTFTIAYKVPINNVLAPPLSLHNLRLEYSDSAAGSRTNAWSFRLADYTAITLPAPIFLETFDGVAEGSLPAGWSVTNATTTQTAGLDLGTLQSDSYKDWVVISSNRLFTAANVSTDDANLRFQISPTVVNGVLVDQLAHGNFIYSDSDQRGNSPSAQVMALFSPDFDLTGRSNIFLSFHSMYEQNQDNIACLEYSTNQGASWLPIIYMVDDENRVADLIRNPDGSTNALDTFNTARGDQAYSLGYGSFIAAPVAQSLFPFISGRINDDPVESKRVELFRLAAADRQSKVRFRFMHAGTSSWYWGIDDFGLYSINTPIISTQPLSQTVDAGSNVTFSVTATGDPPLTYQWKFNGNNIPGATSSSLTVNNLVPANAGLYQVVVSNPSGPTTSSPANLTVISVPQVIIPPLSQLISAGSTLQLSVTTRGAQPQTFQWRLNGADIGGATSATYSKANIQPVDGGPYTVVANNAYGSTTSAVAQITVFTGSVSQDLVTHLKFDNDYLDASGRGNNGTGVGQPETGSIPPSFSGNSTQRVGSAALRITSGQHVALGHPADLQFGSATPFSIAFWIKGAPGAWTGDPSFVGNKNWTSGGNPGFVLAAQGDGGWKWNWRGSGTVRRDTANLGVLTDNSWHHVVATHDRSGFALFYVDGQELGRASIAGDGSIDVLDVNVGNDGTGRYGFANDTGARFVETYMDDVGIWRRVLTPQEIIAIRNAGFSGNDLETAVVGGPVPVPVIVTPPQSLTVSVGGAANFSVKADGGVPLFYQWRFGGANISGATNKTYVISSAQNVNAGSYVVVVSNGGGSITSAPPAVLSVVSAPVITAQPQSSTLHQNLDLNLSVTATGGSLTYQWQLAGTNLPGATNATLPLPSIQPTQAGTYRVIVSNAGGSSPSSNAVIVVQPVGPILVTGQWDFAGNLAASCGQALQYFNATVQADTAFGTTTSFGIPDIAGQPASVLRLTPSTPSWGGYIMHHGAAPNGGAYVNQYTVIYDVLYPTSANATWRSLLQTSTTDANDGDFFVNPANGVGISGNYQGVVSANAWHRIVLALDLSGPAVAKFIDGVKVGYQILGEGTDGRWSLDPFALLIGDEDGDNNTTYLSSVQFRNGKMSDAEIAAMGTPTAAKIPGCITITVQGGNLLIYRTGGLGLGSADNVNGPWTTIVGAPNPYVTPINGSPRKFYRPKN